MPFTTNIWVTSQKPWLRKTREKIEEKKKTVNRWPLTGLINCPTLDMSERKGSPFG